MQNRENFIEYLANNDIQTVIHYPIPIHMQKAYINEYKGDELPITELLSKEVLSLPLWVGMNEEEIQYVIKTINDWK